MKNKCEYCDQKFAARCATIHEEKKYDLNVNIVIKNSLLDVLQIMKKRIKNPQYFKVNSQNFVKFQIQP